MEARLSPPRRTAKTRSQGPAGQKACRSRACAAAAFPELCRDLYPAHHHVPARSIRQRNSELEEELRRQFNTTSELRSEIKTLQADNLKLYEKVRYLQSYRDENSVAKQQAGFSNVVRGDRSSCGTRTSTRRA